MGQYCFSFFQWSLVVILTIATVLVTANYVQTMKNRDKHLIEFHMFYILTILTYLSAIFGAIKQHYIFLIMSAVNLFLLLTMAVIIQLLPHLYLIIYSLIAVKVFIFACCVKHCT